ncbi:MAG: YlxR family protein [Actinobacteria bacterium]|nr:YlxR family protein [Actinomycetota bacterium]
MVRRVSTSPLNGPVRTCVGCRRRSTISDLLRVVAVRGGSDLRIIPDPRRRLAGRGASVHRDPLCLDLAQRRKAIPRALRIPGPVDLSAVREYVTEYGREHEAQRRSTSSDA